MQINSEETGRKQINKTATEQLKTIEQDRVTELFSL